MDTTRVRGGAAAFITTKLASGLAIAPLGVWTVIHVWDNLAVFQGPEAWQSSVTVYKHPISFFVTTFIVLAPLFLHTAWGLKRLATSRPNNLTYPTFENLKYLLQRASAVGVLLFLGAHLWLAFLEPRVLEGQPEPFADIAREMRHHWPTLVVYVLGTLGVAYHLANGVYGFAFGWGLASSKRALRGVQIGAIVFFVVLLAMSWGAIYGLWRAGA